MPQSSGNSSVGPPQGKPRRDQAGRGTGPGTDTGTGTGTANGLAQIHRPGPCARAKKECDQIGVAWSFDGVTWTADATALIPVQTDGNHPRGQIRTALGLVAEPELCSGCYSVLWTEYSTMQGTDGVGFTPVCHAVIRQSNEANTSSLGPAGGSQKNLRYR